MLTSCPTGETVCRAGCYHGLESKADSYHPRPNVEVCRPQRSRRLHPAYNPWCNSCRRLTKILPPTCLSGLDSTPCIGLGFLHSTEGTVPGRGWLGMWHPNKAAWGRGAGATKRPHFPNACLRGFGTEEEAQPDGRLLQHIHVLRTALWASPYGFLVPRFSTTDHSHDLIGQESLHGGTEVVSFMDHLWCTALVRGTAMLLLRGSITKYEVHCLYFKCYLLVLGSGFHG